jgi:tetratricopeptide (TPR) repeat protein
MEETIMAEETAKQPEAPLTLEQFKKVVSGETTLADVAGMREDQLRAVASYGYTFFTEGKLEEAKRIFAGLVALNPKIGPFHTGLGEVLLKEGQVDGALEQFDAALKINPDDPVALVCRGEVYLRQGQINEASVDLKKVIALDPKMNGNPAHFAFRLAVAALQELDRRGIAKDKLEEIGRQVAEKAAKIKNQKLAVPPSAVKLPAGKAEAKTSAKTSKPAAKPATKKSAKK